MRPARITTPLATSRRTLLAGGLAAGVWGVVGAPVPAHAAPSPIGISWPGRQELPTFTRPRHLDALMMSDDTAVDVQLLVTTLQGLVNRTRPEIYVVRGNAT